MKSFTEGRRNFCLLFFKTSVTRRRAAQAFGLALAAALSLPACKKSPSHESRSVSEVMDSVVTRVYRDLTPSQQDTLSEAYLQGFLSPEEKRVLATRYWVFRVDTPVVVSVMRHREQKTVPFWLTESGFKKTELEVKNEEYAYEVWQKEFPAGEVGLGVNGLDKHRPVYFVAVAPVAEKAALKIDPVFPASQHFEKMDVGAFTYHDWDGLTLTEVPAALKGHTLLTTIRGRAREAHLVQAFRDTPYPSGIKPDQLLLTWSSDPKTSVDVQWRTADTVKEGVVHYWKTGTKDTLQAPGEAFRMEDRLLRNDRYIRRYTARLRNLEPGKTYQYRAGAAGSGWSDVASFTTEQPTADGFSYIWFGDTHFSPVYGQMAVKTLQRHPEIAFYQIAGDLVSTGLHRDDWDRLFYNSGNIFSFKPLMPIPGNHDSQDGLGAGMYQEMFSLPRNGPEGIPAEQTYAYTYQDAHFLMIDATQPVAEQTAWIEKQLAGSKARWKFVMLHFPPYNFGEAYPEIRREWCTLFEKYGVDMVMSGHMHYYLRTKPMYNEKPAEGGERGTIYTMSISIEGKQEEWPEEEYAVVRYKGGPLYQHLAIKGNTLLYRCYDADGNTKDELKIVK